jgi:2-isopropylmalate synthase
MWDVFEREYLPDERWLSLEKHETVTGNDGAKTTALVLVDGVAHTITGEGNGPIDAFVKALAKDLSIEVDVVDYAEHAVSHGSDAVAAAYVETVGADGSTRWGVGMHHSILTASLRAVVSAVNGRRRRGQSVSPS